MSEIINANPTILNASDLPTRSSAKSKRKRSFGWAKTGIAPFPSTKALQYDPFATACSAEDSAYSSAVSNSSDEDLDMNGGEGSEGVADATNYEQNDSGVEEIDEQEIYDLISSISDPEHPLSLGELAVVNLPHIKVHNASPTPTNPTPMSSVDVEITPTITHCSLATVIGLGIRIRLERSLPPRYRVTVRIREGTHQSTDQVNKQLNDKERVAAACENETLMGVITNMLSTCK